MRMQRHQGRLRRLVLLIAGIVAATFGLAVALPTAASASQVSSVSVSVDSLTANNLNANWTIDFTPATTITGQVTPPAVADTVTVTFPSGIDASAAAVSGVGGLNCTSPATVTAESTSSVTVTLNGTCTVTGSTATSVDLTNISANANTYAQSGFTVATSQDQTAMAGTGSDIVITAASYAADGSGAVGVSPTSVVASSTGQTLIFTYTAASGGMNSGEVDITVPAGWSLPNVSNAPGCATASTGTVGVSGQTIQVTGVSLAGGASLTVTYGATSGVSCGIGDGVTAPATTGAATFTTQEMSTSSGTLTALASSPTVNVNAATAVDGSGTETVSPTSVVAANTGQTLIFTYTAATGGLNSGEVDITVPSGWTAPIKTNAAGCTTASTGTLSIGAGQVIEVSALTLASNNTLTVTYGATSGGNCAPGDGVVAPSTSGSSTFSTTEKSTSGGTLTAISSSPDVSVSSAPQGSTSSSRPVKVTMTAPLPASVAQSTSATNAMTLTLEDAHGVVAAASGPTTIQLSANPSAGALFATVSGGPSVSSVTIPAGSSSVTVYFGDADPGPVTVAAQPTPPVLAGVSEGVRVTAPAVSPAITLSASRTSVPVEGSFTITAVVTTTISGSSSPGTEPDANAPVTFAVSGPDAAKSSTSVTDSSGVATATFTNHGKPGTDEVTASLAGSSAVATVSVEITASAPGRPAITSTTPGDAQVTVDFSAPSDGGARIASYLVTATDETTRSASKTSGNQSPITVTGLVDGDHYSFTVRASNSVGAGPESAPASAVPTACSGASGNRAFVCALYKDFLGRSAGAAGLQHWVPNIDNATSRSATAQGILTSTEYRKNLIDDVYLQLLHRHVGPARLSSWLSKLESGTTALQLKEQIAASTEFFENAPAAAPACSALTGASAYICALSEDFLGAPPTKANARFTRVLVAHPAKRATVVSAFAESQSAFDLFVTDAYRKLLDRSPTPDDLSYYGPRLERGGMEERQVLVELAGTDEFYRDVTT